MLNADTQRLPHPVVFGPVYDGSQSAVPCRLARCVFGVQRHLKLGRPVHKRAQCRRR
jgi:hypothetical protein